MSLHRNTDERPTRYLVTDNMDPSSASLTQMVPAIRDRAVARKFASFSQALAARPAGADVGTTVARLRGRGTAPLDLASYQLTTGPAAPVVPLRPIRPHPETTRRIERAAAGLAAVMFLAIILRVGVGL